jgi:hypothetical protein
MSAVARDVGAGRGALWFGLLGGAAAWTAHLTLAYAAAEFGCVGGLGVRGYLGVSLVAWLELALTAVTTLVAASATAVAYRAFRRLRPDEAAERYAARAGLLTSGLFTFIILFESIPILYYLHRC